MSLRVLLAFAFCSLASAAEPDLDPKDLPRFPALEPSEAIKSFVIREGFKVELAASEPNIGSPVALSFDEEGRMYVVEMRDYSEHRDEKLGRIRLLEDTNNDGLFEKSTIFAEELAWPTAVICYGGGIFVGATPDIVFLKDTNGDGKADERRIVFTGFGKDQQRLNVQQLLNSFQWGLDNRIHGANGGNGGTIEQVASGAPPIRLGTRDFSFDPRTLVMRAETGGGQHGMSFDDFGRKFVSNNSSHLRMVAYEDRYITNVTGINLPPALVDIAREGPAAEVFRLSPEEPWRQIRTKWRVAGQVSGPIEGGGRASGYFTGATGGTVYRGDAFPPEFRGNVFVGDAGGNLVHRKILEPNGVLFEARRPDDELNREFLASRDTWFRPIQFANAPDGCLYVIDMYREVIEHPWSIPPNLKKLIDLDSGRERGRIWRIAPKDFKPDPPNSFRLNGWHADKLARVFYQSKGEHKPTDEGMARMMRSSLQRSNPLTRVQTMWRLAASDALREEDVALLLKDSNPNVIENALRCAELLKSPNLSFQPLAASTNARVRYQLAWTLSLLQPTNTTALLSQIIQTDASDPYIRAAVLVAAQKEPAELFRALIAQQKFLTREGAIEFLSQLKAPTDAIDAALKRAASLEDEAAAFQLAAAVGAGRTAALQPLLEKARVAISSSRPEIQLAALQLLKHDEPARFKAAVAKVFTGRNADEVRIEAFRSLSRDLRDAATLLWEHWPELSTRVRQSALDQLVRREEGMLLIIDALKAKKISRGDLTAAQSQALRQGYNPAISRPALELLGAVDADRAAVLAKFRPALDTRGDVGAGEKIFTERCATCHRYAGKGIAVGPDLESVRGNGREYLLTHILDPNREVNTRFVMYEAELRDGDTVSGILARESDSEITLRLANAEERTIARSQLKSLKASAQSLMPVGLEEGLDVKAIAGLLDYVGKTP